MWSCITRAARWRASIWPARRSGRRICRSDSARTRCGGTWARRPCWRTAAAIVAVDCTKGQHSYLVAFDLANGEVELEDRRESMRIARGIGPELCDAAGREDRRQGCDRDVGPITSPATMRRPASCCGNAAGSIPTTRAIGSDRFDDGRRRHGGRALRPREVLGGRAHRRTGRHHEIEPVVDQGRLGSGRTHGGKCASWREHRSIASTTAAPAPARSAWPRAGCSVRPLRRLPQPFDRLWRARREVAAGRPIRRARRRSTCVCWIVAAATPAPRLRKLPPGPKPAAQRVRTCRRPCRPPPADTSIDAW